MMQITKKAKYVEVMERALYNTVLAGIAMDGKSFFLCQSVGSMATELYGANLQRACESVRQKWFE